METERKTFQEDFYFHSQYGKYLYQTYAKELPIIDYHCHLLPQEIYENKVFDSLGEIWLAHDHYKWRAMRTFGIEERLESDVCEKLRSVQMDMMTPLESLNLLYELKKMLS